MAATVTDVPAKEEPVATKTAESDMAGVTFVATVDEKEAAGAADEEENVAVEAEVEAVAEEKVEAAAAPAEDEEKEEAKAAEEAAEEATAKEKVLAAAAAAEELDKEIAAATTTTEEKDFELVPGVASELSAIHTKTTRASKRDIEKMDKPRPKRRLVHLSTATKAPTQTAKSSMQEPSIIEVYEYCNDTFH
ncbi:uncharacterized protein CG45076-like [Ananas comosus]|uniref:Uncharacterized protein CG45076-like n=1 Tax=Ananas comosus TaxID=4615 RepID=A0A6P5H0A7_ANACO|nr:uncharacterized protein CG45076-like [Ananas comosus]